MKKPISKTDIQATAFVSTSIPEEANEIKDVRVDKNVDYKRFGTDNLYPQALSALYRKSVALRGIIQSKVVYTVAGGFQLNEEAGEAFDFINNINSKGETLSDLFEKYLIDRNVGGNDYIEVITDKDRSFLNYEHIQFLKCRRHKNGKDVILHPDWQNWRKGDNLETILPLYPNFKNDDGVYRSIVHIKDYEPDFDWYGIPSFIAAMDAAAIGYKTNKWNVSRLDNAFQTSGVLVVEGNMSDDDATALKTEFKKEMTGEGNQGKVMLVIKKLGGEGTEFTPINNNTEGDWIQLHNQSDNDLIMSLGWKKSLAGITESTGFDTSRILTDYQVVKATSIVKEQNKFINLIKKITLEIKGLDLDGLSIINKPPVSLLTELTPDKFTYIWEGRREAGLDYDAEDETQLVFIDSAGSSAPVVEEEVEDVEEIDIEEDDDFEEGEDIENVVKKFINKLRR